MAKKNCNEHVVYCRATELGLDLNSMSSPFNNSQILVIRESLRSESFDSRVVKLFAKPEIKCAVMNELYCALKHGMDFNNFEILYKFVDMPILVFSRIRKLLEDNLINQKILDDIFFDGEKYVFYCRYSYDSKYDFKDSIDSRSSYRKSGIAKMLDVIRLIMINSDLRRRFLSYVESNDQETVQAALHLCSELAEEQIADVLEYKVSLEYVKCYLSQNRSGKSWRGLVSFLGLHERSADYIKAYLDNKIFEIPKKDLLMFFELESNSLIDELFFKYNLSIDNLRKLENHCFKNNENRFGKLSSYNSYTIDQSTDRRMAIVAKSIYYWLSEGFPIELIRDYIDVCDDNSLAARIINIGFGCDISPRDACIVVCDRTLYLRIKKVSKLLAEGFSVQDIKNEIKVDGRLKPTLAARKQ